MKIWLNLLLFSVIFADKANSKRKKKKSVGDSRLERKEIDIGQLDREYEADDDVELEDLPFYDERKPKQGMDTRKLDGRDHVTTWSESKKGQQFGLYVNTVDGLSEDEYATLFDVWQMNMINCCNFELTFLPIEGSKMLVLLPDGKHLLPFANMLRQIERYQDKNCHTFVVENTHMLCGGHPEWDPKRPGKNVEAIEKWDDYHKEQDKKKRKAKVEVWRDTPVTKEEQINKAKGKTEL